MLHDPAADFTLPISSIPAMPVKAKPKRLLAASFSLAVALPSVVSGLYLAFVAQDQFVTKIAFAIREEETQSAVSANSIFQSTAPRDSDLLNIFLRSPAAAARLDAALGLKNHYAISNDPVFAFIGQPTAEDFAAYWPRQIRVGHDRPSGIIEVEVRAFSAQMAQKLAEGLIVEASALTNGLLRDARSGKTTFTAEEVEKASVNLESAEAALELFRSENNLSDADAEASAHLARVNQLAAQEISAEIELELIPSLDPRRHSAERRLAAIHERRAQMAYDAPRESESLLIYGRLVFELELARDSYRLARANHEEAHFDALRDGRHIAVLIPPALPESPQEPRRLLLWGLCTSFAFLIWSCGSLIVAALRERR